MRVLGSSVLVFEWFVLALAIPVAVNIGGVSASTAWAVLGVATVLIAAATATMGGPAGVRLGWAVQAIALAAGVVVPLLLILGAIFAALYYAAIRLGTSVDRAKRARAAAGPGAVPAGSTPTMEAGSTAATAAAASNNAPRTGEGAS